MVRQLQVQLFSFLIFIFSVIGLGPSTVRAESLRCDAIFSDSSKNKYEALAEELGLNYLKPPTPAGYRRVILSSRTYHKNDGTLGKTLHYYRYFRPDGSIIRPRVHATEYKDVAAKFESFKPEANWDDVWISPDEDSHIQVLAKNTRGENVAIYHEDWGAGAAKAKFKRVQKFGNFVAPLRRDLLKTLRMTSLDTSSKEKVEATALLLLMSGRIRVGDVKYLTANGTTGVTTLRKDQVITNSKSQVFLRYIGKAGNKNPDAPTYTTIEITESTLKKSILALLESHSEDPRLLIYSTRAESFTALSPEYLNRRLREMTSSDPLSSTFSVKDLRTWAATVKTVEELIRAGKPPETLTRKDAILKIVAKNVSRLLNNTPGVARKDYIDPRILNPESYDKLWLLCAQQFPELIQLAQKNSKDDLNAKYNPDFETLTLNFLNSLTE